MTENTTTDRLTDNVRSWRWTLFEVLLRTFISIALIAGAVGIFIAAGRGGLSKREEKPEVSMPAVECVTVVEHQGGIRFDVDGVVIPFRRIQVPAEVAGRIEEKSENCRVGRTVAREEWLMRIDPQDFDLELRLLEEQLRQAEVDLDELDIDIKSRARQIELAQKDLTLKEDEVGRYEGIDDAGVYSQSELDSAKLKVLQAQDVLYTEQDQLDLLKVRRDRVIAARDLANAKLEKACLDLSRTEIESPIAGVITAEPVEAGSFVQRGGTVAVIQDTSCMEIRCSLHMHQMQWIWRSTQAVEPADGAGDSYRLPKTPVIVEFDSGTTQFSWKGDLAYFDGAQIDQQTRMIPCRVLVQDPSDVHVEGHSETALTNAPITLMSGMFVTVKIHATPDFALLQLPEDAVQPGKTVWTLRQSETGEDDVPRLHCSEIRIAHAGKGTVLVYADGSDLQAGDQVVVSPLASPTENTPVEIREAE